MNPLIYVLIIVAAVILAVILFLLLQTRSRKQRPTVSPYTQALTHLINGETEMAAQKFREAAQKDSSNVDAFLRLGNIYRDTGKVQRAIKIHTELTMRSEITLAQRLEAYKMLALDYLAADNIVRALEYTDTLINQNKKDLWALELKRKLLEQRGDFHGAFDQEKKIQKLKATSDPKQLAMIKSQEAIELLRQEKGRDGRLRFREAIKILPGCALAYLNWGDSYLKEDRVQDAVNVWAKFMEANPDQAYLAFHRMESVLFDLGRFGEMGDHYRKVLDKRPDNVHAIVALARFLTKMGESDQALEVLQDGLDRNPDSLWIRRNMIKIYADTKATHQVLKLAHDILDRVMTEEYTFTCKVCGRTTKEPTWFCPECRSWDSYDW
jgi:lipopolysaccharide biosynthesis regulator YciM